MHEKFLNEEVIRLLEKHNVSQAELSRRLGLYQSSMSHIYTKRRNLGERLFIRILRKGFRLPEKKVRQIFADAVLAKYADDPDLKS